MRAIVLHKRPFGESDLIVRFLLEDGQVVAGFAPGGRNSKKRFPHQFHLAGLYDVNWNRSIGQDKMIRIQSCELLKFHSALGAELETLSRWASILEWISLDEGSTFDFQSILSLMESLSQRGGLNDYFAFFFQQMKQHGVLPQLSTCVICADSVESRTIRFSLAEGGVAHADCAEGAFISAQTLQLFRWLMLTAEELAGSREQVTQSLEKAEILHEMDRFTLPYLSHQLGKSLKSHKFLQELDPEQNRKSQDSEPGVFELIKETLDLRTAL